MKEGTIEAHCPWCREQGSNIWRKRNPESIEPGSRIVSRTLFLTEPKAGSAVECMNCKIQYGNRDDLNLGAADNPNARLQAKLGELKRGWTRLRDTHEMTDAKWQVVLHELRENQVAEYGWTRAPTFLAKGPKFKRSKTAIICRFGGAEIRLKLAPVQTPKRKGKHAVPRLKGHGIAWFKHPVDEADQILQRAKESFVDEPPEDANLSNWAENANKELRSARWALQRKEPAQETPCR